MVLEEEAQEKARSVFRKELQEELQEAESAWLEKMAPRWREESEEVRIPLDSSVFFPPRSLFLFAWCFFIKDSYGFLWISN